MGTLTTTRRYLLPARATRIALLAWLLVFLVPFIHLLGYTSQEPVVLGRYSKRLIVLLALYGGGVGLVLTGLVVAARDGRRLGSLITDFVISLRNRRALFLSLVVILPILIGVGLNLGQRYGLGRSAVIQFSLVALVLLAECTFLLPGRSVGEQKEVLIRMAMVVFGIVSVLLLMETILRRQPSLIPDVVRPHLPGDGMFLRADLIFDRPIQVGYRYRPLQDRWIEFRASDGNLYRSLGGDIRPLSMAEDAVLAQVHFETDENGYPNSPPLRDQYGIVISGDSFSVQGPAAEPWPSIVERISKRPVLNLSMPGYSTRQETEAIKAFGLGKHAEWNILAYFEGNDLIIDAARFELKRQSGMSWFEHDLREAGPYGSSVAIQTLVHGTAAVAQEIWNFGVAKFQLSGIAPIDHEYRYPITFSPEGVEMRLAFAGIHLSGLTAARRDIAGSVNYSLIEEALLDLKSATDSDGARLLLVYIPSKPHVYLPLVEDDLAWHRLLDGVPSVVLTPSGYLASSNEVRSTKALIEENIDSQRQLIQELAAQHGISFVDLTVAFQAEAAGGVELFYATDTHWNQAGHQLAARIISEFITNADQGDA